MTENNPYGAQDPKNQAYGGYEDPAAQYSAQSNSTPGQPAQPQQYPDYSQGQSANPYNSTPNQGAPQYNSQGNPAYGQSYPAYQGQSGYGQPMFERQQAEKDAQTSMILGIIGLVLGLGIILGPIGLVYANKATKGGATPTAGKVLGWINIVVGILVVIGTIAFIGLIIAGAGYSEFSTY